MKYLRLGQRGSSSSASSDPDGSKAGTPAGLRPLRAAKTLSPNVEEAPWVLLASTLLTRGLLSEVFAAEGLLVEASRGPSAGAPKRAFLPRDLRGSGDGGTRMPSLAYADKTSDLPPEPSHESS